MIDYEKKYNEALERAKKWYYAPNADKIPTYANRVIEEIFPELAESEDEKIRKWLIAQLKIKIGDNATLNNMIYKAIAWLERQKATDKEIVFRPLAGTDIIAAANQAIEKIEIGKEVILAFNGAYIHVNGKTVAEICNEYFAWTERQGESKPTDKVEPKFKVGDIIINIHYRWDGKHRIREITDGKYIFDNGSYIDIKEQNSWELADKVEPKFHEGDWIISKYMHLVMQIINNDIGYYKTVETDGTERYDSYDFIERNFKLWSIQDAKDGDVLVDDLGNICIYKESSLKNMYYSYCYGNHKYFVDGGGSHVIEDTCPATKEQRNTLFKKIKEEGYEWDAEKKELKKIEGEYENYKRQVLSDIEMEILSFLQNKIRTKK